MSQDPMTSIVQNDQVQNFLVQKGIEIFTTQLELGVRIRQHFPFFGIDSKIQLARLLSGILEDLHKDIEKSSGEQKKDA